MVVVPYYRRLLATVGALDASGALREAGPNGMAVGSIFTHNGQSLPTFARTHEAMGRQEVWGDAIANALNHALHDMLQLERGGIVIERAHCTTRGT